MALLASYNPKAMVDNGVSDQRYWNLGRRVLQGIGLTDWDSPQFKTKSPLQPDLEWAGRRWCTSLGQQVWVLPADVEIWREVDLKACHSLREVAETTVPIGTEASVEAR